MVNGAVWRCLFGVALFALGAKGSPAAAPVPAWPMPNPPGVGLPNPASYDTQSLAVVIDNVTGLMWQREAPAQLSTWEEALGYCSSLRLGGHEGWRLPARIELVSLVDFTRQAPALNEGVFLGARGNFWSGSATGKSTRREAWYVSFANGGTSSAGVSLTQHVRCVRTHVRRAEPGSARYRVQGQSSNGTVLDTWTGLTWQQTPSGAAYTFREAQQYCATLHLAGSGWRLPSLNEAQTLVEEAKAKGPAIDAEAFPGMPHVALFWTSSASARSPSAAWFVNFAIGDTADVALAGADVVELKNSARCVR